MRYVAILVVAALLMVAAQFFAAGPAATGLGKLSGSTSMAIPQDTVIRANALACQALLETSILPISENKRLEARAGVGTDKLAVEIHGQVLRFMTKASVEAGMATPAEFQVLRNDDEVLAAVSYQTGALGSTLGSFLLNKKNGLAVWTKSRPSFLVDKQPDTQAFYLRCQ